MKPHKHAELIKAWADGAEIQYRVNDANLGWSDWKSFKDLERFLTDPWWDYRIKPEPKKDVVLYRSITLDVPPCPAEPNGLLGVGCHQRTNAKLTFDGSTGKLKSVEVL